MSLTLKRHESLVSPTDALKAFQLICEAVDSPVSLAQYLRAQHGLYDELVTSDFNPLHYQSVAAARGDYLVKSVLRKADFLDTSFNRRDAAMNKFQEAELICKRTNVKFDLLETAEGARALSTDDPILWQTLVKARTFVLRILGNSPKLGQLRFGPGVNQGVKRFVTRSRKYSEYLHCTPELIPYLPDIMGPVWLQTLEEVVVSQGMSLSFVPKDAKTERTIGVEPDLNGYVQLGIGAALRALFKPYVDLDIGQDWNRFLASKAVDWSLSTIDLSSASDTISTSLVRFLLPEAWFDLLDLCRSRTYKIAGDHPHMKLEKFSSMGNGFTFELESIIFYSLVRACGSTAALTTCYGDDIICERAKFTEVLHVLEFCGFSVNGKKTFRDGLFFESCGEDYFNGVNIRPFFWKELKPNSIFKMANDISRYASKPVTNSVSYRDASYYPAYQFVRQLWPKAEVPPYIPQGMGDVGFISGYSHAKAYCKIKGLADGHCGFSTRALKYRPDKWKIHRSVGGLLSVLDRPTGQPPVSRPTPIIGSVRWVAGIRKYATTQFTPPLDGVESVKDSGYYQVGRVTVFGQWLGLGDWG